MKELACAGWRQVRAVCSAAEGGAVQSTTSACCVPP